MYKANHPIVLLVGDSFLIDDAYSEILKTFKKNISGEILEQSYYLADDSLEKILVEARTLPFLAAGQIFRIRDLRKIKKADVELIASYLEEPSATTLLVFETDKLAKTDALSKLIKKQGAAIYLESDGQQSMIKRFLKDKLKSTGKTISPRAAMLLEQSVGDMPSFLESMLDRLIAYAGTKTEIDESMVREFEESWVESDVFQLTNALAAKQCGRALDLLHEHMGDSPGDAVALLGILHWQIKRLWVASALKADGAPQSVILKKCRISPRQAPYFLKQLNQFSRQALEDALDKLFQLDWKIKTGQADAKIALESWMVSATA